MPFEHHSPEAVEAAAREMRRLVVDMAYQSRTGHLGPSLCIVDILAVLYTRVLNVDPTSPHHNDRDRFILSKGHAAPALYAALSMKGFFPREDAITKFCVDGGQFHGHPCMHAGPGIEFSSGSLGHGLSVAAGIAVGLRKQGNPARVYALLGDGECQEGSVWEAAMFATTHGLSRLTAIVDDNRFQGFGATPQVHTVDLAKVWDSFGWQVIQCDGHDHAALEAAFLLADAADRPSVIIARTVAGKGIAAIEDTLRSHYDVLDEAGYKQALTDLGYAE